MGYEYTPISETNRFDVLLRPHLAQLYRFAYRLCMDKHQSEDLLQDLLVKLYPRMNELAEIQNLRSWLERSLYNLYIDSFRRNKRNPVQLGDEEYQDALNITPTLVDNPESSLEEQQLMKRIQHCLGRLNDDQRQLIGLHDIEGYTLPELAAILDTPVGTLKSRLHRAREKLKQSLDDGTFGPY